jgi:lysine 6-dehydrogenase
VKRVVVLGCGLVGSVIARDLARDADLEVTAVDASEQALARLAGEVGVRTRRADLSARDEIHGAVREADAVVGAVPGFLGHRMLETVIGSGRPIADISFAPEDPLTLDAFARERGVTAVVDCGVSPGLSNFAVGRAAARMDAIDDVAIYVGGLPIRRGRPFDYAIVFSATDVIEEYTRPARVIENGAVVTRPALSEIETVEVPGVGAVEGFLTDGLRTILTTVRARNMREKTLRYPGHAAAMRSLREAGFFSSRPLGETTARAWTERLLFDAWKLEPGEEEFTYLKVSVAGTRGGRARRYTAELFDRTDTKTGTTSMARTTGFPCAIVARLLVRREYADPGVRPLERMAESAAACEKLVAGLEERGVAWTEKEETA